ncbi:ParB/RepB/Spo0J family partition protein [Azospirillum halopraeferens]|uniref:ParB/RepB/Spo0J family partition protein n=1 Tax=Azospirillum halopraeferens TaxID=34010 RepID=UPI00040B9B71|nr:ParB/RepB/Spo0J family partition protein [Azospirillum halopraeferens]
MPPKIKPNTEFLKSVGDGVDPIFRSLRHGPQIIEADVERIEANPDQPRRHFDEAELRALADSIEKHGLQQPVGLKQLEPGRWQLVYGERRLRACRLLGRQTIFGTLVNAADTDEIALIENLHRADLLPLEEATAFRALMQRHGYSQAALAAVVGRDRADVNRTLKLLDLPDAIREALPAVKPAPARYRLYKLAAEKDPARQAALWETIRRETAPSPDEGTEAGVAQPAHPARLPRGSGAALDALLRTARAVTKDPHALRGRPVAAAERESLLRLRDAIDAVLADDADG